MQLSRDLARMSGACCALVAGLLCHSSSARGDSPWEIASDVLGYSDTDNVQVLSPQLTIRREVDEDGGQVSARAVVDAISAASVDVVSQATGRFTEVRTEGSVAASKSIRAWLPSVGYRFSSEADYLSHGGNLGLQRRLAGGDTTLSGGYGLTFDTIGRSGSPSSVFSESLLTHSGEVGVTQVLSKKTLVRGVLSLSVQQGYMEKPYRFVPLFDQAGIEAARADGVALGLDSFDDYRLAFRPPEAVPDLRVRSALAARILHFVERFDASVRLDYQLYVDSWGVTGHVIEPALYLPLPAGLRVNTFGRLYLQSAASFWEREYVVSSATAIPRWRTLDRNLSPYWSGTGGARLEFQRWTLAAYAEGSVMYTEFRDYLLLDSRVAVIAMAGVRWNP